MNKKKKVLKIKTGNVLLEDSEFAFWDEFYARTDRDIQTIDVEKLEDVTNLIIKSKIPHLKTN